MLCLLTWAVFNFRNITISASPISADKFLNESATYFDSYFVQS